MNVWASVFLGIIAAATLAMAIVQVGFIVAAGRLARRMERLAEQLERDLEPLFVHLNAIGRDASRVAGLAVARVERADRVLGDATEKIDEAMSMVQSVLAAPAREGRAIMSGFRAVLEALREFRSEPGRSRGEDEDALFI